MTLAELELGQQLRGERHGAAAVGEAAQQRPHPAHALGIESIGGLVEDQDLGAAGQCVGETEALVRSSALIMTAGSRRPV